MSTIENLIADVEAFCEAHGLSQTEFGIRALNNPAFMTKLKRGDDILASTIDRVRRFMAEYQRGPLASRRKGESRSAA